MLERILAFGIVVGLLLGVAAWANDAPEEASEAEPRAVETAAPACPDAGCPPPAPAARAASLDDEDDDKEREREKDRREKDEEEREEKRENGKKGKRGRD